MFIFALMVVPVVFIQYTSDIWTAVALISLAAAAHRDMERKYIYYRFRYVS